MFELIVPTIALFIAGFTLGHLKAYPIAQIFILFVTAYTTLFPLMVFILSPFPFTGIFGYHQFVFSCLFLFPLFYFILNQSRQSYVRLNVPKDASLNHLAPVALILSAFMFLGISIIYDLFLVRLGYSDFLITTGSTPTVFLYHFRLSVETSFFIILFLITIIRSYPNEKYVQYYKFALYVYVAIFGTFFLINSRMQFLLLVLLVISSNYKGGGINLARLAKIGLALVVLALALTLLREFVIEQNYRLDASSGATLLQETLLLIAARLNSVGMIDMAGQSGYNVFLPNLEGLWFLIRFNLSMIIDPAYYEYMKSIEITSPSVFVMNGLLLRNDVDFPKSMMVEFLLIFGALFLPILAFYLAKIVTHIQSILRSSYPTSKTFLVALYVLPMLMQFEKEFSGFLLSVIKWLPMLVMIIFLRPKAETSLIKQRTTAGV